MRLHLREKLHWVIDASHRYMKHRQTGLGVSAVNKRITGLPVGAVMAGIVKFDGKQRPKCLPVAEDKVAVLLTDAAECAKIALGRKQQVGKPNLALHGRHWSDSLKQDGVKLGFGGREQAGGGGVAAGPGRRNFAGYRDFVGCCDLWDAPSACLPQYASHDEQHKNAG